ncbi:MAG: hypothetical protein ISR65_14505 [Bacteriovoracaceae bacterium]|nr:hypothetical protein [Bacteriovoracaceae bacterium]
MAAWQFSIKLVSRKELSEKFKAIPNIMDNNSYDELKGWGRNYPHKEIYDILSKELPKNKSWSTDIQLWGKEDTHCFELLYEKGDLEEISARIDLRNFNDNLIHLISRLSSLLDAIAICESGKIIEASYKDIMKEISVSNANKFLNNPIKYLDDLEDK